MQSGFTIRGALALTWVSRTWRAIAHNDPQLWSTLRLRDPTPSHLVLVEQWLARTGSTKLDIAIIGNAEPIHHGREDILINGILDVVMAHSAQIQHLIINSTVSIRQFSDPEAVPRIRGLKTLVLRYSYMPFTLKQQFRAVVQKSPIEKLDWKHVLETDESFTCGAHFTSCIRVLGCEVPRWAPFELTLPSLLHLHVLCIDIVEYDETSFPISGLTFPCLRSLDLRGSPQFKDDFVSSLTAPKLQQLDLDFNPFYSVDIARVSEFVDRSRCKLTVFTGHLSVPSESSNWEEYRRLWEALVNVETLTIAFTATTFPCHAHVSHLPALRRLHYSYIHFPRLDPASLFCHLGLPSIEQLKFDGYGSAIFPALDTVYLSGSRVKQFTCRAASESCDHIRPHLCHRKSCVLKLLTHASLAQLEELTPVVRDASMLVRILLEYPLLLPSLKQIHLKCESVSDQLVQEIIDVRPLLNVTIEHLSLSYFWSPASNIPKAFSPPSLAYNVSDFHAI
ncbi:hypothetical protein VNI00_018368 [Paramarasmius palmivorus]|uniref:F-box domain-containing protein n=1 Tax=Paramarasmius palmivorus TaxID=297713 RepID=A0AAW0AZC8_9AGAR